MNRRDRASAVFFLVLGAGVLFQGVRLGLKADLDMGPGFLPALVGGFLSLLAAILLGQSLLGKGEAGSRSSFWANPGGWKAVVLTLLAVGLYPFALYSIGFPLATFVLLCFLFAVISRLPWWVSGFWGAGTSIAAYFIFEVWLKANLPRGFWGS
jgi:hypothetical protein